MLNEIIKFAVITIYALVCGMLTKNIMEKKGYEDTNFWFGMGFVFGIFGLIGTLFKPPKEVN